MPLPAFEVPIALQYILRLLLSALFGAAVGLEREIRSKEAGIRTHLIVSLASCLMVLVSKYGFADLVGQPGIGLDPSRIAASVVTGIGFLGAGTILSRRGRGVTGLTTAAGLWATVGIGMAVGAGMYLIATFSTVLILVIQAILHQDLSILRHTDVTLTVVLRDVPGELEWLTGTLAGLELHPASYHCSREEGALTVVLELDHPPCGVQGLPKLLEPLVEDPRVQSVRWQ